MEAGGASEGSAIGCWNGRRSRKSMKAPPPSLQDACARSLFRSHTVSPAPWCFIQRSTTPPLLYTLPHCLPLPGAVYRGVQPLPYCILSLVLYTAEYNPSLIVTHHTPHNPPASNTPPDCIISFPLITLQHPTPLFTVLYTLHLTDYHPTSPVTILSPHLHPTLLAVYTPHTS